VKNWTGKHTSPGVVVEPRKPAARPECWTAPETLNDRMVLFGNKGRWLDVALRVGLPTPHTALVSW
jgi:hypothetical protein